MCIIALLLHIRIGVYIDYIYILDLDWPRMLKVARLEDRIPAVAEMHRFILSTRRSGGTAHKGGGCDQSIGSTVSNAIVHCP